MSTVLVIAEIPAARPRAEVDVAPLFGRFSTGMEWLPPAADNAAIGRFSDGMQQLSVSSATERFGRFSTGMEHEPEMPEALRVGSFADGSKWVDWR
jgi:hypothetical protein